jgi:hypothetical protein
MGETGMVLQYFPKGMSYCDYAIQFTALPVVP